MAPRSVGVAGAPLSGQDKELFGLRGVVSIREHHAFSGEGQGGTLRLSGSGRCDFAGAPAQPLQGGCGMGFTLEGTRSHHGGAAGRGCAAGRCDTRQRSGRVRAAGGSRGADCPSRGARAPLSGSALPALSLPSPPWRLRR